MHTLTQFLNVNCCSFVVFPVWIPWDSCFRPMRHIITSTHHYSHNSAPPTTSSDGFLWTTTSSCCCNARSNSSNSSSTCCCNTLLQHPVLLHYTLLHHPLSRKDNASIKCSDVLTAASHATIAAVVIPGSTSTHMKVNVDATFGQKMSPIWTYFTKLHRRFRRRDKPQGKNVILPASPRRQRSVVCTPITIPRL